MTKHQGSQYHSNVEIPTISGVNPPNRYLYILTQVCSLVKCLVFYFKTVANPYCPVQSAGKELQKQSPLALEIKKAPDFSKRPMLCMVRAEGLEPPRRETLDPKSVQKVRFCNIHFIILQYLQHFGSILGLAVLV